VESGPLRRITLADLIKIQTFAGEFSLKQLPRSLAADLVVNFSPSIMEEPPHFIFAKPSFRMPPSDEANPQSLLDTLLVIFYIRSHFSESKELWELIVQKAERWVAQFLQDEIDLEDVHKWIWERWHPAVSFTAPEEAVIGQSMGKSDSRRLQPAEEASQSESEILAGKGKGAVNME
jgi:hypothetical protein